MSSTTLAECLARLTTPPSVSNSSTLASNAATSFLNASTTSFRSCGDTEMGGECEMQGE